MSLTKAQLEALNVSSFPNNNEGLITPEILRVYNSSSIAATVNQDVYTTESASFNTRIIAAENTGYVTTASFNSFTASTNTFTASISTSVGLLQTFSGSQYKVDSASFSSRILAVTGSSINTGSFATTGSNSFSGSQIIAGSMTSSLDIKVAGVKMGFGNQLGTHSIAIGTSTLLNNTGADSTAIGYQALQNNTTGNENTAIGFNALNGQTTAQRNTAVGADAGTTNTGDNNVFVGWTAGLAAAGGGNNTVIGAYAGRNIKNNSNTVVGYFAGIDIKSGSANTFIGNSAGEKVSGSYNTFLGGYKGIGNESNVIALADGQENVRAIYNSGWVFTGSVDISGSLSSSLAQGYVLVGDSNNRTTLVATSSFGTSINTGSFATTGSNSFVGNQRITGSLTISSSAANDLIVIGNQSITGSLSVNENIQTSGSTGHTTISEGAIYVQNTDDSFNTQIQPADIQLQINTGDIIGMTPSASATVDLDGTWLGASIYTAYDGAYRPMFGFQTQNTWTDGRITALKPLVVSGSLTITGSSSFTELTGSLASFSASVDSRLLAAGGQSQIQDEGTILGNVTSFNFNGAGVTASVSAGTASVTIAGGGGAAFPYTGSAIITGSLVVTGSITEKGDNIYLVNANQTLPFNITQSAGGTNLIFGWNGDSTNVEQSQLTGSFSITGSNNIILTGLIGDENFAADPGFRAYLSGSNNIIYGQNSIFNGILINSSSVMLPKMDSNILGGYVNLGFTTSALAKPTFSNNLMAGDNTFTTITHPSGSVNMTGNLGNRGITSTANKTTLGLLTTIQNNVFIGGAATTLNHNSSSIQYTGNIGTITVTNNLSSSTSTAVNNVTVQNNTFLGTSNSLLISGSNTSARRNINNNLVAGRSNTISSEYTGSSVGHLVSTAVIGQNLIVSASGTSTTVGGGAFFGRYNDVTNLLADSGKMVFAVGTGTGTSARKTALSVDSSSVVNISGSLTVTSSVLNIDGSGNISASRFLATSNAGGTPGAFAYSAASSGGVANTFNTALGKDFLDLYQYQGQAYAFNMHLTSDQLNIYSGSAFNFQLQTNGSGASQFGGATYYALASGSYTASVGAGSPIIGLDQMGNNNGGFEINDFKAPSIFEKSLLINGGLFISASNSPKWGGGLNIEASNAGYALKATGSVIITGSLQLNGQTGFASLESNTFTNTQIVSASIYIAPNNNSNQLYLPSGSNKQTGIFVLNGGNPGTATISNSQVNANSLIFLTKQSNANSGNGTVSVTSKGSGTFSVTSDHNGDADTVAFMIINAS